MESQAVADDQLWGHRLMINLNNPEEINDYITLFCKNVFSKTPESSDSDKEAWISVFLLLALFQMQECEDEQLWHEFEDEIIHGNRYFPQSIILDKIKELSSYATTNVKAGTTLYRSRAYSDKDFYKNSYVKNWMEFLIRELPELSLVESDFKDNSAKISMIFETLYSKYDVVELIKEKQSMFDVNSNKFWGFSAEDNDAPPKENTKSMRANPEGIRYLYAAEEVKTAIAEMRPQLTQNFSVAMIKSKKDLRLFDFTNENIESGNGCRLFSKNVLGRAFSNINYGIH